MEKHIIDKNTYEEYKAIVAQKKAFQKKVNTYFGIVLGLTFVVSLILETTSDIAWGFMGFAITFLAFAITNAVIYAPISKLTQEIDDYEKAQEEEKRHIEEKLRKQQENTAQNVMEKLDQIKKTAIIETHTSKDNNDTMNRGVVGALLFGATGAIVGTATAEEKSYTTFLIVFNDDSRATQTVENGSTLYNHYIKFLEV